MNNEEIFAAWSPAASIWSPWAKPVLFAYLNSAAGISVTPEPLDVRNWCPTVTQRVVLVVDLPGAESVLMGCCLAEQGYRPVPLYNAVPLPFAAPVLDFSPRNIAAVDVLPIIGALRSEAEKLARLQLVADAPPAFLLDANRHANGGLVSRDAFDNRSVCFTTDFPSANFLLAHGYQKILLIQKGHRVPRSDLAHVLRRWQEGGLELVRLVLDLPDLPQAFTIEPPPWYGAMFQRVLSAFGLRRASGGGFGGWMPESSAAG